MDLRFEPQEWKSRVKWRTRTDVRTLPDLSAGLESCPTPSKVPTPQIARLTAITTTQVDPMPHQQTLVDTSSIFIRDSGAHTSTLSPRSRCAVPKVPQLDDGIEELAPLSLAAIQQYQ